VNKKIINLIHYDLISREGTACTGLYLASDSVVMGNFAGGGWVVGDIYFKKNLYTGTTKVCVL
jgi:hypothetical protein